MSKAAIDPNFDLVKQRVIEGSDMDQKHLLRPLLLFKGPQSEGRIRALWNLLVSMKDADVPSVGEAIKLGRNEDFRHLCGLHASPASTNFNSIISRVIIRKDVASLIPGLWEYAIRLAHSAGATYYALESVPEYAVRVRSDRLWRLMPDHLRPQRKHKKPVRKPKEKLTELYPYISGQPTEEHGMLLAIDQIVPKGLPNSVRCDVCQDMVVAVLSGETTVDNLRGDTREYLKKFWKMFPNKYGHISLDAPVGGTEDMDWSNLLSAKTSRLVV